MAKLVSDTSGNLRKGVFYCLGVTWNDEIIALEEPVEDWIIARRHPTNDALIDAGRPGYLAIEDLPSKQDSVEIKDCPANPSHVALSYFSAVRGDARGYSRLSTFVESTYGMLAVSKELYLRLDALKPKKARLDLFKIIVNQSDLPTPEVWALQFLGRIRKRPPKLIDTANECPNCHRGKIVCESCGLLIMSCENCGEQMHIHEDVHKGPGDKRIPYARDRKMVVEGKTWDGSDLVQGCYASKRFIDWLLRIHAAPFYAKPVYFCVDGMSDQQKKWLDDLQKPFEV